MPFIMRRVKMSGPDSPETILQVIGPSPRAAAACVRVQRVCCVAFQRACAQRCTSVCMQFLVACGVCESEKREEAWTVPEGVRVDHSKEWRAGRNE